MVTKPKDVTDAELAILQILWTRSSATIRELTETLYPRGHESDYATVKKLLARLETKGFVDRDASSMAHGFSARVSRDDLIGRRLKDLAKQLCGGSPTPLLMHLLKNKGFSAAERDQLHELLNELVRTKPKPKRRK